MWWHKSGIEHTFIDIALLTGPRSAEITCCLLRVSGWKYESAGGRERGVREGKRSEGGREGERGKAVMWKTAERGRGRGGRQGGREGGRKERTKIYLRILTFNNDYGLILHLIKNLTKCPLVVTRDLEIALQLLLFLVKIWNGAKIRLLWCEIILYGLHFQEFNIRHREMIDDCDIRFAGKLNLCVFICRQSVGKTRYFFLTLAYGAFPW